MYKKFYLLSFIAITRLTKIFLLLIVEFYDLVYFVSYDFLVKMLWQSFLKSSQYRSNNNVSNVKNS